ncbi:hypothetical protein PIB30_062829 [Stylosanthes scabra]|uniref:Uncharacterized protein n=1 Tax=Stylosanthes scabra TaxID=79078 RepID=A0ABU6SL85_9FABA|nr:hypothetical protein [Stylosanthes scabra]
MATMQQHYEQRWDTLQQKFDDAQEENRKNFGAINQRMNQIDDQLSFLCYSHQMANESMVREEEMCQERMRYEKVLEEAAAQKEKEQNKGKARGVEEDYDDEETEDEGGEW